MKFAAVQSLEIRSCSFYSNASPLNICQFVIGLKYEAPNAMKVYVV